MIRHLYIENYALIRKLEVDFCSGLSVITGETGAGKSIILGALGLILGQRADTGVLMKKEAKCIIEGSFLLRSYGLESFFEKNDIDFDENTILRREINPAGKSRAFINDTPVNLNQMKDLGEMLVDIHSQYENLALRHAFFQLEVLDNMARHQEILNQYELSFRELREIRVYLEKLKEKERQSKLDQDYYRFLFHELDEARLDEEEQSRLEEEMRILSHSEEIKSGLFKVSQLLSHNEPNLLDQLNNANSLINNLKSYLPSLEDLDSRLKSMYIDLKDVHSEVERMEAQVHYDPGAIEKITERLDHLYTLQKKHRVQSVKELIGLRNDFDMRLNAISSLEEEIGIKEAEMNQKNEEAFGLAGRISAGRAGVIPKVTAMLESILAEVGMPQAKLEIEHGVLENLSESGIDRVRFLFTANKGGELKEISKVASGGELSRIMLGIKSLVSMNKLLPTIIFDEIDMGVSGEIADKVGNILSRLSETKQVLVITHLPQIASKGKSHYFVYKTVDKQSAKTDIRQLNEDERVAEIARMISGESISDAAMQTARELLTNNQN